jgi:hypothetical protein
MLSLHCPSCQRPLTLPDHLRGTWVRCPACKATFQAPGDVPEVVAAVPLPEADPEPPARERSGRGRQSEGDPFAFESEKAGYRRVRVQAKTQGPSNYLWTAVVLDVLFSFGGLFFRLLDLQYSLYNAAYAAGALVASLFILVVFYYVPLVFVGIGASALSRRSSYGLAMTGAIIALLVSLLTLIGAGLAGVVGLIALAHGSGFGLLLGVIAVLGLLGVIFGVLGGIQALQTLNDDEVQRSFR